MERKYCVISREIIEIGKKPIPIYAGRDLIENKYVYDWTTCTGDSPRCRKCPKERLRNYLKDVDDE